MEDETTELQAFTIPCLSLIEEFFEDAEQADQDTINDLARYEVAKWAHYAYAS